MIHAKRIVKKVVLGMAMFSLFIGLPSPSLAKGELKRISGDNRYDTSRQIRDLTQGVETIVIVNGQKFADAIVTLFHKCACCSCF